MTSLREDIKMFYLILKTFQIYSIYSSLNYSNEICFNGTMSKWRKIWHVLLNPKLYIWSEKIHETSYWDNKIKYSTIGNWINKWIIILFVYSFCFKTTNSRFRKTCHIFDTVRRSNLESTKEDCRTTREIHLLLRCTVKLIISVYGTEASTKL